MLLLTKGQSAENIIVTLNEKRTLTSGYYVFAFQHITTKDFVYKVYAFAEDESSYPDRYNEFEINTQSLFGSSLAGDWVYNVYESATNTTTTTGLTVVETGIMKLQEATAFEYDTYQTTTTYKAYAG